MGVFFFLCIINNAALWGKDPAVELLGCRACLFINSIDHITLLFKVGLSVSVHAHLHSIEALFPHIISKYRIIRHYSVMQCDSWKG